MSFALYALGMLVLIAGVIYVCHLMHVPQRWVIGIAIIVGLRHHGRGHQHAHQGSQLGSQLRLPASLPT